MSSNSKKVRLQKVIAESGLASRRKAEELIQAGKVFVNGVQATIGQSVDAASDHIMVGKTKIEVEKKYYGILNKPLEFLVSRKSQGGKKRIYDLPDMKKLPPSAQAVGRLDFMTEGLLLVTNDGELAHRLMHPSYEITKVYHVHVSQPLEPESFSSFKKGILLSDGIARGLIKTLKSEDPFWYEVAVSEGRNRLVRRVFAFFNLKVKRLIRVQLAHLDLSKISSGQIRELNANEVRMLKNTVDLR